MHRLPDDRYDYDQRGHALVGRRGNTFRLGDRLIVSIAAVDMDERTLEYGMVQVVATMTKKQAASEKTKRSRKKVDGKKSRKPKRKRRR